MKSDICDIDVDNALSARMILSGVLCWFNLFTLGAPILIFYAAFGIVMPFAVVLSPMFGVIAYYLPTQVLLKTLFVESPDRVRYRVVTLAFALYLAVWGALGIWSFIDFANTPL
jgi:hypothetical protein